VHFARGFGRHVELVIPRAAMYGNGSRTLSHRPTASTAAPFFRYPEQVPMIPIHRPTLLALLLLATVSPAQEAGRPSADRKTPGDHGPFLSCTLMRKLPDKKREVVSLKGIVIRNPDHNSDFLSVCFDTDLLTVTAAWEPNLFGEAETGFLDFTNTMIVNHKGTDLPAIRGRQLVGATGPGLVTKESDGDPRPDKLGPLPPEWGRYNGLYVNGKRVIVSYSLRGTEILESYKSFAIDNISNHVMKRTFDVAPHDEPLSIRLVDWPGAVLTAHATTPEKRKWKTKHNGPEWLLTKEREAISAATIEAQDGVRVSGEGATLKLDLAPSDKSKHFTVLICREQVDQLKAAVADGFFTFMVEAHGAYSALRELTKGGNARWEAIGSKGTLGKSNQPYVLDRIELPDKNPWNAWMRLTAFDFFPDGSAAVATLNGDVWLVTGLDESLTNVTWTRFATGLYEPLGLKVVDNKIHVLGRDQITRLHDLNGDGEADFYENFNNAGVVNPSYHGFAFELQTDSQGNFYYTRTGHRADPGYPAHGCVIRVSKDGTRHDVIATGLRAPNALTTGPNDEIAVADNQGNWVPTTRLDILSPQSRRDALPPFLGYLPQHHRETAPTECPPPTLWIPHKLDPSAGSAAWITTDKWGPFTNNLAHTSFGRAALLMVLPDEQYKQAAVLRMPLNFDTGIMRARFHPIDGQLYVAGVGGGWQAGGPRDGGFYRIRYTGRPVHLPHRFRVEKTGVRLSFPNPLDPESAADPDNYGVERWNYRWTAEYGSPEYSVSDPTKKGRDEVEVKSVTLSNDRKSVLLELADFQPVMQLMIQTHVKAADGTDIETEVYGTINRIR
jgi:hypothetical protein